MSNKKIWLIRHGESVANAKGRTSDPALVPLTQAGHDQANSIVEHFTTAPDLIIKSSYIRTTETSKPLRDKFPHIPCEIWPVHEFTYISPSRCQNTNMTDRKPFVNGYWLRADPDYCDGEGAESFNGFLVRARTTLSMLKSREEKFIAIFTHGQFMCGVKWLLHHKDDRNKISDVLAFRKYISTLAPLNGQEMELMLSQEICYSVIK